MMTDHVHEWILWTGAYTGSIAYIKCECGERLRTTEIEAMLNAAERLSAEDAEWISEEGISREFIVFNQDKVDALRAYAKARGK